MVMQRIKPRQRVDRLISERRAPRRQWGKLIYLGLLATIVIAILDLAFGHFFYLEASGLVTRDSYVVGAEHRGTVVALDVEEGAEVRAGDLLAVVSSQTVLDRLADLRARRLDLLTDLNSARQRLALIAETAEAARLRADELSASSDRLRQGHERGIVTGDRLSEVIDDAYDALADVKRLDTERVEMRAAVPLIEAKIADVERTIADLEQNYDDGRIVARQDGVIANLAVAPGSVTTPGAPLMEIYYGQRYVLAQVPTGTLYDIQPGEVVTVNAGVRSLEGSVARLYPIANRVRAEFQRTFQPRDRQQLVRIDLAEEAAALPLFTKVEITKPVLANVIATASASVRHTVQQVAGRDAAATAVSVQGRDPGDPDQPQQAAPAARKAIEVN